MNRWGQSFLLLGAVVVAASSASLLAGCALGTAAMPNLTATAIVNQKAHKATIRMTANGGGEAMAGVVLTYPDGHRRLLVTAVLSRGDAVRASDELTAGTYTYKIYAIPAGSRAGAFPVGEIVDQNVVASGTFVIP
jgi:hypothetical protein